MGNRRKVALIVLLIPLTLLGAVGTCYQMTGGHLYQPRPVTVQVLDYDTEKGINGAVVAVRWYAVDSFCIHGMCVSGEAAVAEARTGDDGIAIVIPPQRRRKGWSVASNHNQNIVVHKVGYVVAAVTGLTTHKSSEAPKFFLLPPDQFVDGPRALAGTLRGVQEDNMLRYDAVRSPFPLLEREVAHTMKNASVEVRSQVAALREKGDP